MNGPLPPIRSWAIVVAGLTAFALSFLWYSPLVFGGVWTALSDADPGAMPIWKMLIAPARELVTAAVLAHLMVRLGIARWQGAAALGFALWLAFHAVQMSGAILWDDMPWQLGAVHGGDWLMKMLVMAVLLAVLARRSDGAVT